MSVNGKGFQKLWKEHRVLPRCRLTACSKCRKHFSVMKCSYGLEFDVTNAYDLSDTDGIDIRGVFLSYRQIQTNPYVTACSTPWWLVVLKASLNRICDPTFSAYEMPLKEWVVLLCVETGVLEGRPVADGPGHVLSRVSESSSTHKPFHWCQCSVYGRRLGEEDRRSDSSFYLFTSVCFYQPHVPLHCVLTVRFSLQPLSTDCVFIPQDTLPEKLAIYEKNIDEFDAFVETLQ